jgi:hypothetical protein
MFMCPLRLSNEVAICNPSSHRCELREPSSLVCSTTPPPPGIAIGPFPEIHTCPDKYICSSEFKGNSNSKVGHCFNKIPCNNVNKPCITGLQCVDDPSDTCTGQTSCDKICAPNYQVNLKSCEGLYPTGNCTSGKEVCVDDPRDSCVPNQGGVNCPTICAPAISLCSDMKCNSNEKCTICKDPNNNSNPMAICLNRNTGKCPPIPQACGGIAGIPCRKHGEVCVDNPNDNCDPTQGGADCMGICQPSKCALIRCKAGTHCDDCNGNPQCVPDGGTCSGGGGFCNLACIKDKPICTVCNGKATCLGKNEQCPPPPVCNLFCMKQTPKCTICDGKPTCLPTDSDCPIPPPTCAAITCDSKSKCITCGGIDLCYPKNKECPCNVVDCSIDKPECKLCGGKAMCLPTGQGCPKLPGV